MRDSLPDGRFNTKNNQDLPGYRGFEVGGLKGQWKVALDNSFRPYKYVLYGAYICIRRLIFTYGHTNTDTEKFCVHPCIHSTYVYSSTYPYSMYTVVHIRVYTVHMYTAYIYLYSSGLP